MIMVWAGLVLVRTSSKLQMAVFSLSPHVAGRQQELSGDPFHKGTNPTHEGPTLMT